MRTDDEMYSLILGFAEKDERIRVVVLNGSRTNPNVPEDKLRDFDVVYLVTDTDAFTSGTEWLDVFGEKLVWQLPDKKRFFPNEHDYSGTGILMQFTDGNRIDLTIDSVENYRPYCFDDRLSRVLLDKDGILPALPPSDDSSHYITAPTQDGFTACRCEFWWVSCYVAKGLWRHQVLYAHSCFENCIRKELKKMLTWYAGSLHGFDRSVGKAGDRLMELLPQEVWDKFLSCYSDLKEENMRQALKNTCELFTDISGRVAKHYGFVFCDEDEKPDSWDENVPKYLFSEREI